MHVEKENTGNINVLLSRIKEKKKCIINSTFITALRTVMSRGFFKRDSSGLM